MPNIRVHRYETPAAGFLGWIEPEDGSWILFVAADGAVFFGERDATGAVAG